MAEEKPEDPRIVTRPERNAATSFRDNAGGDPVEAQAYNGRPNDAYVPNSTLAERAKLRQKAEKQVRAQEDEGVEDKAVSSASTKRRSRK